MRMIDADLLMKEASHLWASTPDREELSKKLMNAINHAPTVESVRDSDRLPRVLRREEIYSLPHGYCILERMGEDRWTEDYLMDVLLYCVGVTDIATFVTMDGLERFIMADYGKTWRIWTDIPTDEERSAVPWQN